ncbi:MAG: TerC family protein [Steroidobacteraceae bacterium]
MGFDNLFHYLNLTLEVFFLDLLLSGDNALVIALACRSLPPALTKRAMLIGIDGAIALRILLTTVASLLLHIPLLKLVGGVALTVIAIKLTIEEERDTESDKSPRKNPPDLWSAVGTIILADLVMSVDNVVALAAVTQGNIFFLTMGLLMSVPLLMFGSLFVTALLRRYPLLKRVGGAMLGWIAGDIAISDPMIAGWVNQQSPALTIVVPILVVVFVLVESRIMEGAQATADALRPKLRPKAVIINSPPAVIEQAPATVSITVASQSVEADAPSPISAAKTLETPRQSVPGSTLPPDAGTTSHVQAPRNIRFRLSVWIAVAIAVALLWILFRFLSLDFATTTPAIQFTPPTRPR